MLKDIDKMVNMTKVKEEYLVDKKMKLLLHHRMFKTTGRCSSDEVSDRQSII